MEFDAPEERAIDGRHAAVHADDDALRAEQHGLPLAEYQRHPKWARLLRHFIFHAGQPDWFIASQRQAWELFTNLSMPGRKDENWRFANVSALQFDAFKRVAGGDVPAFAGLEKVAARVVRRASRRPCDSRHWEKWA